MKCQFVVGVLFFCLLLFFSVSSSVNAADFPKQPTQIKLEGATMPPVAFSHDVHVEKEKIDCVKCHHKDPQDPKACAACHREATKAYQLSAACSKCHGKDAKGYQRDAFHRNCRGCHKEMAAKGSKAPTKCMECHKK